MPYELFLAVRYLRSRRRGRAARVTTFAAVVGIACGVAAYIAASALAAGFRDEMQDKILRGTAHVTVTAGEGAPTADARVILRAIETTPGVSRAALTTYYGALLVGADANAYAVVRGVAPNSPAMLDEVRRTLVAGRVAEEFTETLAGEPPVSVIIGAELSARTGLAVGSLAQLVAAEPALRSPASAPRLTPVRVAGIFRSDLHDYDATWIYMPLHAAIEIGRGMGDDAATPPTISVETTDAYRVGEVAVRLRERLGAGWQVVTWEEANRALFAALELERRTVGAIISLVCVIAGLNILTTLVLLVAERRRDIATLAALGARPRNVMTVFLIEGTALGGVGALAGVVVGLALCHLGNRFGFVSLPPDVYAISLVPFHSTLR